MKCKSCGAELLPGSKFCGKCRAPVVAATSWNPSRISMGVNRMPQGIALGVEERVVKQYKIGRYTFRQGSIWVIVTNKRVIRYEESTWIGMQNNQIDEIFIDSVHGTYTRMRRSISVLGFIIALILLVQGIPCFFFRPYGFNELPGIAMGIVCLLIGSIILVKSFKPTLEFAFLGAIGGPALNTVVNSRGRIFRNDGNSVVFQFKPTQETTVMLKEIGACVYDIKTLGDAVIEKWS